jgi:hypothetical protein
MAAIVPLSARAAGAYLVNFGCAASRAWNVFTCSEHITGKARSATVTFTPGKTRWHTKVVLHLTRR